MLIAPSRRATGRRRGTPDSREAAARRWRRSSSGIASRPSISLGIEAGQAEIEIRGVEFLQFQGEQFLVPIRPRHGAVHHQPEGLHLRRRPLVAEDHGDCGRVAAGPRAQLARGLQAQMAVHHLAVAAGEHRDLEAELADAAAHAIHGGIVLAGIAGVEDQPVDGPGLDLYRWLRGRDHIAMPFCIVAP